MRIGRYKISFGWTLWLQTYRPTIVRHFLFIWLIKEAKPTDVDKKPQFLPGTEMDYEGHRYMYVRGKDQILKDSGVSRC